MKVTDEQKELIKEEYELWFNEQYGNKSKQERKKLSQFFTPPSLTIQMLEKCLYSSLENKKILDPTVGAGGLLAACIICGANPELCYGVDFDPLMVEICRKRLSVLGVPKDNIHEGNALKSHDLDIKNFGPDYKPEKEIEQLNLFE